MAFPPTGKVVLVKFIKTTEGDFMKKIMYCLGLLVIIGEFQVAWGASAEKIEVVCGDTSSFFSQTYNHNELRVVFRENVEVILLDHLFVAANESTCSIYQAQLGRLLVGMDFHTFKNSTFECRNDADGTYRLYMANQKQPAKKVFTFLGRSEDSVRSNCYDAENSIRNGQNHSALKDY